MLRVVILHVFFVYIDFTLLIFIIQNRNSNIINSFWIKVVKIIIIKINIIKGYTINVSDLSKNC